MSELRPYPKGGDEAGLHGEHRTKTRKSKLIVKLLIGLVVLAPIVAHLILIVFLGGPGRLHSP